MEKAIEIIKAKRSDLHMELDCLNSSDMDRVISVNESIRILNEILTEIENAKQ